MNYTAENLSPAAKAFLSSPVSKDVSSAVVSRIISGEYVVFPGFCDLHVHFREPGFSYKETIASGSRAAAAGGYTTVLTMPNLNPVPDSIEHINEEREIINKDAVIEVLPYAAITVGEKGETLSDIEGLAPLSAAFSDDGRGVQSGGMMRAAMEKVKANGSLIAAHCEDNSLLHGGYIHDGVYAAAHGHKGICSESEWGPIARDIELCRQTGCPYHVCHISCKESVEIIRKAKAEGVNITCETGPHYLTLDENGLQEDGRFKMNPPLRSSDDRKALIEGVLDGTIDAIATDHAPHSAAEKARGLAGSAFGITGIELAFPVLYTKLVKTGIVPLEKIIHLLTDSPRERFGIAKKEDYCVWDLNEEFTVDSGKFISMGKATPFEGEKLYGRCILTVCGGKVVK